MTIARLGELDLPLHDQDERGAWMHMPASGTGNKHVSLDHKVGPGAGMDHEIGWLVDAVRIDRGTDGKRPLCDRDHIRQGPRSRARRRGRVLLLAALLSGLTGILSQSRQEDAVSRQESASRE
jgi:hypothetical protein